MFKHSKRYMIISESWRPDIKREVNRQVAECDTLKELHEYENMVIDMYKDVKKPVKPIGGRIGITSDYKKKLPDGMSIVSKTYGLYTQKFAVWDCCENEGARSWGFVTIDFEEEKFLRTYGDCLMEHPATDFICKNQYSHELLVNKDRFFRKDNEIPKDYKWDEGEYDGWLQFRWGDGKNAIGYVEEYKPKTKTKPEAIAEEASEEDVQEFLDSQEQPKSYSPFAGLSELLK